MWLKCIWHPKNAIFMQNFAMSATPGPMTKTELFLCKTELFPYKIQSHHVINHKIKQMEKHCQQKKQQPTNLTSARHPPPLQKCRTKDLWNSRSSSKYIDCYKEWQISFILDPTCLQISLPVEHCNLCKPPKCSISSCIIHYYNIIINGWWMPTDI